VAPELTRGEFLAQSGKTCLTLAAGGLLVLGCARIQSVDVEKTRPPDSPPNYLCKESEVSPAYYFRKGRLRGVLVRTKDRIKGYRNVCTHLGGPNRLEGDALRCLWHGARFSPETGAVLRGSARRPLPALNLELRDGLVLLAQA